MVNAEKYLGVLNCLRSRMRRVRPEQRGRGSWCSRYDRAASHKAVILHEFLTRKGIVALDHLLYSPDLVLRDFSLIQKTKLAMKEKRFYSVPTTHRPSPRSGRGVRTASPSDKFGARFRTFINYV